VGFGAEMDVGEGDATETGGWIVVDGPETWHGDMRLDAGGGWRWLVMRMKICGIGESLNF